MYHLSTCFAILARRGREFIEVVACDEFLAICNSVQAPEITHVANGGVKPRPSSRVTRLGDFPPVGWKFTHFGSFFSIEGVAHILSYFFQGKEYSPILVKMHSASFWTIFSQAHLIALLRSQRWVRHQNDGGFFRANWITFWLISNHSLKLKQEKKNFFSGVSRVGATFFCRQPSCRQSCCR
jgi:hypothetical protein